jgi:hypothetical protein
VAEGGDGIEHADEVGKNVRVLGAVDGGCTAVPLSKLCGDCISSLQQEPPVSKNLARVGWTELIDILDRMLGQLVDAVWVAAQGRAIGHMARDAAIGHDPCDRSDRVGAPAETDQEDPIAFLIQSDDRGVAIDNVPSDPEARRHAGEIVQPPHPANLEMTPSDAEPRPAS